MKLYFVRHGKTEWNLDDRLQGVKDSPLLPQSYEDMKNCGQALKEIPFKAVYTSPIKRAKETAEGIVSQFGYDVPMYERPGFVELSFGDLEGEKFLTAKETFPNEMFYLRNHPDKYDPSAFNGENYDSMIKRSTTVVKEAIEDNETGPLLFVGHGAMLIACMRTLLGVPIERIREVEGMLDNNSVTVLSFNDGEFILDDWNNTDFLS